MAGTLALSELHKHSYRIDLFLENYKKEVPFELCDGSTINFVFSEETYNLIQEQNPKASTPILLGVDSKYYRLSQLRKTNEYGGKGEGFGTRVEQKEIDTLNIQIEDIKAEFQIPTVPISISNTVYQVASVSKVGGTPKADMVFKDEKKEVVWISHKDGKHPRDWQQYAGLSDLYDHAETIAFIGDVHSAFPNGLESGTCVGRKIKDQKLKKRAVYGLDYGKKYGIDNVSYIIQGSISLTKEDDYYKLNANLIHKNGDILKGDYEPILMANYRTDRDQFNVKNCRMGIYPISSRKIGKWI